MSKLFSDPVYKNMRESEDAWLELAIEPFKFDLNDVLIKLPSKIELSNIEMTRLLVDRYSSWGIDISVKAALDSQFHQIMDELDHRESKAITDCFSWSIDSEGVTINTKTMEMDGEITLIKSKEFFTEEDAKDFASGLWRFIDIRTNDKSGAISRMNEIMDILDATDERKSRSMQRKSNSIRKRIKDIYTNDLWLIRDYRLMKNICLWIRDYCLYGKQHSIMNLTRIKCMTHKKMPIYSLEEMK